MTSARKQLETAHVSVLHNGTSTTILLNQSMHVMTVPYQSCSGSSITKSMWIYSHGTFGTSKG